MKISWSTTPNKIELTNRNTGETAIINVEFDENYIVLSGENWITKEPIPAPRPQPQPSGDVDYEYKYLRIPKKQSSTLPVGTINLKSDDDRSQPTEFMEAKVLIPKQLLGLCKNVEVVEE